MDYSSLHLKGWRSLSGDDFGGEEERRGKSSRAGAIQAVTLIKGPRSRRSEKGSPGAQGS